MRNFTFPFRALWLIGWLLIWVELYQGVVCAEARLVKLGFTLPLTGRLAHVGEDIRRGIELGIKDFSGETLRYEAIFDDNQHDPKLAAVSANKLLKFDRVDVLLSIWDMADVVAPLAERQGTPHLAIRWDPQVAERYSLTMTMESTYISYVDSLIELLKHLKVSSAALLVEEAQGWVLAGEYFKKAAPQHGIAVLADERIMDSGGDRRAEITRALSRKPEIVVILSNPPHTENLLRRVREQAPSQKITGYFEVLEEPRLVEGIPFVAQFAASAWFETRFRNFYGRRYVARAPQAYDLMLLLTVALERNPQVKFGAELIGVLSEIKNLPGASGVLSVNAAKNIESNCVWQVARNGRFEPLEK
ncbi:MAG: hypothetical protein DCC75_04390 [Proteobacteria bacterium]|nr:MAG: hypothetical protein DCC75_04390 [Pseudomonadota bacterium]